MQTIQPVSQVLQYKKQLVANEYMLILNPHEELRTKIQQVKRDFSEKYEVAAYYATKPHLALVRFSQVSMMEERILGRLRTIAMGFSPFKVELKDYGSLPTHSIFINTVSKLPIRALVKEIRDIQRLMKLDKEQKPHFIEEPNLIIANKLLPWQYEKGWQEYRHKHFTGRFVADSMLLLKRRVGDKAWQIAERFVFQNLPVATVQGELFG